MPLLEDDTEVIRVPCEEHLHEWLVVEIFRSGKSGAYAHAAHVVHATVATVAGVHAVIHLRMVHVGVVHVIHGDEKILGQKKTFCELELTDLKERRT